MAEKRFLVTSRGSKKDTGEFYCWCTEIRTTKQSEFLGDNRMLLDAPGYPVGTIVEIEQAVKASPVK